MLEMPASLYPLCAYRQFIVYRSVPSEARPGKTDKLPCDYRSGKTANAHDPAIWIDAVTAIQVANTWGSNYGIGFVFTEHDPFWFLDIDNCLAEGQWSSVAQQLCQYLNGAAVEVSQSGKGLHLFGTGKPPVHGCRNDAFGLEFYHAGRFVALTGNSAIGNASFEASHLLPGLVTAYFPPDGSQLVEQAWTIEACPEWRGPDDDNELIRRAIQSRSTASAFGSKASFADLWNANATALANFYPDPSRDFNHSQADSALAQHLAFWTGKNCERIRTLMQRSALARDKWEREDYLPRTILAVVARQVDVLQDKPMELPAAPAAADAGIVENPGLTGVTGGTFLGAIEQAKLFEGCVYIRSQHRAFLPGGIILKPEQFKVHFGGYRFVMDAGNEKSTKDAWEAWTQNENFRCPKVDDICFKPNQAPGAIINRNGQTFVNTYWPVIIPRKIGDPAPFLLHLEKVLPNERDRTILISYMAACIQYKGFKFQWAPLLQGVEGNGKTLFSRCVAEAIGRKYIHWPKASKLSKEFNAWMVGKLFFAVEDIYVPDAKREIIEELKPMITGGDGLEIEGKGVDQISADICGNFMFNSNHKDAVRKTANDRRFCVMFSAQQQASDLQRDGMQGDYFPKLYDWLRAEGYAIVTDYLMNYEIPRELNPALDCQRAPETSTTHEAIRNSAGGVEQEIQEAVEQGLPGFCGGWVSSIWLERLLERLGLNRRVTHNKRKELLEGMGYRYHPALHDGRVNNQVIPDGGKPRLFIHEDSLANQISSPAEAARAYEQANAKANVTGLPFAVKR